MNCPCKPARTWYDLLHACLEKEAADSGLSSAQSQAILALLKKENFLNYKTKGTGTVSLLVEGGTFPNHNPPN